MYRNVLRSPEKGIQKQLLDTPDYHNATFAAKREMFMNFLAKARSDSKDLLISDSVDLQRRGIESQKAEILPMLGDKDRQDAEKKALEAMQTVAPLTEEERANVARWGYLDDGTARDNQMLLQRYAVPQAEGSKVSQ
jgi:hypothetical protein